MKNELITLQKIDGIYDIQPPLSPPLSGLEIFLLSLLFIIFISAGISLLWKTFFSDKGKARRNINKLHESYLQKVISTHDAAYQLCSILQKGLNLNYIGKNNQLPEKLLPRKKEWIVFTEDLSSLRYKNNTHEQTDINNIFISSLYWLKLWP